MFPLGTRSRGLLAGGALLALAAAYATTPIVARSAAGPLPAIPSVAPRPAAEARLAVVLPRRDPFTAEPEATAQRAPEVAALARIPAAINALPPNPGAAALLPPTALRVTAIISGRRPYALVEEDGGTRMVSVGDLLHGERVVAIAADEIRLTHDAILRIAPSTPTSPPEIVLPMVPNGALPPPSPIPQTTSLSGGSP
jgi:hypothetical protein